MGVTCRDAHVAEWDPPPSRVRGGMLLIVPYGWARLNPQLRGGELEGLGMGSQIRWGGVL